MPDTLVKALLPLSLMGPPAQREYAPIQMSGRDETSKPGFLEHMTPMLIASLADILSTEAVRKKGANGEENNPIINKLQVGGSSAPALGIGYVLEALALHLLSKEHPRLGEALKTAQTASSGTMAGQNLALVGKPWPSDDRLSVWPRTH